MGAEQWIDGDEALAEFRATRFSARALAPVILDSPVTLLNADVGIGKSTALDGLLEHAPLASAFDLIVVLAAQTRNLHERKLIRSPQPGSVLLRPRPRTDCGPLDAEWRRHERNGTTAYAKARVCGRCPRHATCFWPRQYGAGLRGTRLVFGTHQHLLVNRRFLAHLRTMTGARRTLLFLDEADVLAASFRVAIAPADLRRFHDAVGRAPLAPGVRQRWLEQTALLLRARTEDLRGPGWSFPFPAPSDVLAIQEAGLAHDSDFRWVGYDLQGFAAARPDQRWRDPRGNIVVISTPYPADRTVILSAGMPPRYAERQLGLEPGSLALPLAGACCRHRGTRFYNLCSLLGAATRFVRNHPQILDLFGQLVLRNIAHNKLTLLIVRKRFKQLCAAYLARRLARWGQAVTVVPSDGLGPEPPDPATLPLVHYGLNGVNAFEHYDAVYCLCGFYIDENVLRDAIADVEADALRFPVSIRLTGRPPRRRAGTFDDRYRDSDADAVARAYYRQLETNTVLQAVGRVRYATRPREIIAFQCSEIPGVRLDGEFHSLRELRAFFGLRTGSEYDRQQQAAAARRLRADGLTTRQIAARLGVSERTVRNRLSRKGGVDE